MKNINKLALLILLLSIFFFSCKKNSAPAVIPFMKLDTNGKVVNYNSCFTAEISFDGVPQTTITSQQGAGQFTITLNHAPGYLKTGQVYQAQTIKSVSTDNCVTFNYVPSSSSDDVYGFPSSIYNPIGSVTLTEVTATAIKGTFSAGIFTNDNGLNLLYSITNGSFCSGPSAYSVNFETN